MKREQLQKKIQDLEHWLKMNHSEHLGVSTIQTDLRRAKQELEELDNPRTFERDTFDIQNHNFNSKPDERQ